MKVVIEMKKLISIFLVCLLALSVSACSANKESEAQTATAQAQSENQSEQSETKAEQTQAQSQNAQTKEVSLSVPVMQTADWNSYESTEYNGKEEMTVNMSIPSGYSADGTVIYDEAGLKYAEVNGVVLLKDGQTAFDTVEVDSTHYDIKYIEKSSGEVGEGSSAHNYEVVVATAPTDDGQSIKYVYYYALDFGEYAVEITINSSEKQNAISSEHKTILESVTVA